MKRETLQKVISLASFIFEDKDYRKFIRLMTGDEYTSARLILDDKMEEFDIVLLLEEQDEVILSQYKMTKELEDLVMNLIEEEENVERKEIREFIAGC